MQTCVALWVAVFFFAAPTVGQTLLTTVEVTPDLVAWLNYDNLVPASTAAAGLNCGAGNIYNPLLYKCQSCPALQVPDPTVTDALGNYLQCRCALGYQSTAVDCSADLSGNCVGLKCALCDESKQLTAYSDGLKGCAKCGAPAGFNNLLHDCECPAGQALIEKDALGNRLVSKTCAACPAGTQVILAPVTIAGKAYQVTTPHPHAHAHAPHPRTLMAPALSLCPTRH